MTTRAVLLTASLLSLGCASQGSPQGTDAMDVSVEELRSMAETTPDTASIFDSVDIAGSGTLELTTQDLPPACPDPLPTGCTELAYVGPTEDPTEYPGSEPFLALVDEVLATAGENDELIALTREDFPVWDFQEGQGAKGRLKWEKRVRNLYFDIPAFTEVFGKTLSAHPDDVAKLLSFLSDKSDWYVDSDSLVPLLAKVDELSDQPEAAHLAVQALFELGGRPFDWNANPLNPLPDQYQAAFARYFFTLYLVISLQREAFVEAEAIIPIDQNLYKKASIARSFDDLAAPDGLEAFGNLTDFRQLTRGAQLLSVALDRLAADLSGWEMVDRYEFETPLGLVVVSGTGPDTFVEQEPGYILIVDLGGDDDYWGSMAASRPALPISAILDLGGNDKYETTTAEPTLGAGYLGYGMLWDLDGDDTYIGRYSSVASACLGIGILNDQAGDDFYDSISASQASATLGLALLLDRKGGDHYYAFRNSQGLASYRGAALLLDADGDDTYEAEDDLVIYPSAQNPKYNANMSQGAGYGYRNDAVDFTDTYAGGIALLADLAGNDSYSGGLFDQGVGYWFGIGFLLDLDGDDTYTGVWYNFGAAAHFAGGVHVDKAGNDEYFCLQDQCMGEGRDYSLGFMANLAGDDVYYGKGGRNIGAGDLYGTGIFWDPAGEDTYKQDQPSGIGHVFCEKFYKNSFTFGLFMDTGKSTDIYQTPALHPSNENSWTQVGNNNDEEFQNVIAIGVDQ